MLSRRSFFQFDVVSRHNGNAATKSASPAQNVFGKLKEVDRCKATKLAGPTLSLALTACGGGGGGSAPPPPGASNPAAPQPVATLLKPANEPEAVRFLTRAQLAASPAEMTRLTSAGYVSWLDGEIAKPVSETAVAAYIRMGGEDFANNDAFTLNFHTQVMWQQFLDSNDQLRKRVAFALSEYFVVSSNGVDALWHGLGLCKYWDILNKYAFGNFRDLLEEVTLNPIMGQYLSLNGSQKEDSKSGRRPDENYAREIMQLFTIGLVQLNGDGSVKVDASGNPLPTYSNEDVTNIARALSGWGWHVPATDELNQAPWLTPGYMKRQMTSDPALWRHSWVGRPSEHSTLEANFLGVTIPANTDASQALKIVLDTLFNHANTPIFFTKQMIQRFVTSNPSPAYIERVGKIFVDNGQGVRGDLGAVFKAILMDSEALGTAGPTYGKVREPFLRLVQWARTFNLKKPASGRYDLFDTSQQSNSLGQMVLRAPSVFNFFRPGYVPPGTAIASNNLVAPEFQIINEISTIGYANYIHDVVTKWNNVNLQPDYTAEAAIANDSTALINRIDLLLTGGQLSQLNKDRIKQAADSITLPATNDTDARMNRVAAAIVLTMVSPQYLIQK